MVTELRREFGGDIRETKRRRCLASLLFLFLLFLNLFKNDSRRN